MHDLPVLMFIVHQAVFYVNVNRLIKQVIMSSPNSKRIGLNQFEMLNQTKGLWAYVLSTWDKTC